MEKREKWEETKLITNQNRKGVKSSTKRHVQKTEDQPRLQLLIYLRKKKIKVHSAKVLQLHEEDTWGILFIQ